MFLLQFKSIFFKNQKFEQMGTKHGDGEQPSFKYFFKVSKTIK